MEYAAWSGDSLERCWELPVPILDRDHDGRYLAAAGGPAQLVERYRQAASGPQADDPCSPGDSRPAGQRFAVAGYDDSWSSRLPSPQLSYIAIGHNRPRVRASTRGSAPDLTEIARALESLIEVRRARPDEEVVITTNTADMADRWTPKTDLPKCLSSGPIGWSLSASLAWDTPPRCGWSGHERGCPDDTDRPVGKPDRRRGRADRSMELVKAQPPTWSTPG